MAAGDGTRGAIYHAFLVMEDKGQAVAALTLDIQARLTQLGLPTALSGVLLDLGKPELWAGALLGSSPTYTTEQRHQFLLAVIDCARIVLAPEMAPPDRAFAVERVAGLLRLLEVDAKIVEYVADSATLQAKPKPGAKSKSPAKRKR